MVDGFPCATKLLGFPDSAPQKVGMTMVLGAIVVHNPAVYPITLRDHLT